MISSCRLSIFSKQIFPCCYVEDVCLQIVAPPEWTPRRDGYENIDMTIPAPIQQMVTGCQGLYTQFNIQKKPLTVNEFKKLAMSDK